MGRRPFATRVVPTLVVNYPVAILPDTTMASDSSNRYRSVALSRLMKLMMTLPRNVPPAAGVVGRRIFAKRSNWSASSVGPALP